MNALLFAVLLGFSLPSSLPEASGNLILQIENISSDHGALMVAVFARPDDFLKEGRECWRKRIETFTQGRHRMEIADFPHGQYAIAVYHDVNGNGKLDKNLVGIPSEPYAFSNNPRAKWKRPNFLDSRVHFHTPRLELVLELLKWKEY